MKRKIRLSENDLKNIIKNRIIESFLNSETIFQEENNGKDGRLSDMNTETKEEEEKRESVEDFFENPAVNDATYAYDLKDVKPQKGKDTNAMKNARCEFEKKLHHKKNSAGYSYSFTSAEINHLANKISSNNKLNESINRAVNESFKKMKHSINEGQYDNSPITKWVYWCFNFPFPQEWIPQIEWNGAGADHFMNKFKEAYQSAGSKGVMNRFFVELDKVNQQKLIDYVMNNY